MEDTNIMAHIKSLTAKKEGLYQKENLGPVNLIDIHPYGSVSIVSNLTFLADVVFNWRYSLGDGVYRPSGSFNFTGTKPDKRYIGTG